MPSMSSSTFHVSVDRGAHSEAVCDFHLLSNAARSSGVSTSVGSPVPSHGTSIAPWRRTSTRRALVTGELERLGPQRAGDQHGIAAHAAVGRDRERRAVLERGGDASGTRPAPTSGWSARPTTTASIVRPRSERPQDGVQARRDAALGCVVAHDLDTCRDGRRDPVVGDDAEHGFPPARHRGRERVCEQWPAPELEQRLRHVATEPNAPARREDRDRDVVQRASSARRTSTCARCGAELG